MWADLLKVRNLYLQGSKFIVGNGKKILFWKDRWLYDQPIAPIYLDLFKMVQQQDITLAEVTRNLHLLTFSRWLVDDWERQWNSILDDMSRISLKDCNDSVYWRFSKKGLFSVKSMYDSLTANDSGPYHKKSGRVGSLVKSKSFSAWLSITQF